MGIFDSGGGYVRMCVCGAMLFSGNAHLHESCKAPERCIPIRLDDIGAHQKPGNPIGYGVKMVAQSTASLSVSSAFALPQGFQFTTRLK